MSPDDAAAADEPALISYGLRVFARSPEGFYVEVVADETERPLEWLAKTTRGLKLQKFEPVNPFPSPSAPAPANAQAPRQPAQAPQNNGGRPQAQGNRGGPPGGRQGGAQGGQQRRGGGGYRGPIYDVCPWSDHDVYDNREKKAGGWRGPWFACKDRDCGWAVWRTDGTYDA